MLNTILAPAVFVLRFLLYLSQGTCTIFCSFSQLCIPDNPAGNDMLKVNNSNTRARYEICLKLTIKTPERRHWRRFGVFIYS